MEENNNVTPYDEMMRTRDIQILKAIVPFLDFNARRQTSFLIQYLEFRQARTIFSNRESSLAACEVPDTPDRRTAILSAVRQYCGPKEQEMIDTMLNLFCIMDNYDPLSSL